MTLAEFMLAWKGYEDDNFVQASMHRRTAYEMYLNRPRSKGSMPITIERFMPLPTDSLRQYRSTGKTKAIHSAFLEKLRKEKSNG
jgi:hypothetical protein